MKFVDGLPVVTGASDARDSAMMAGTLVWLGLSEVDLSRYFINGKPVRHPTEIWSNAHKPEHFSRDQMIMLAVGLKKQGKFDLVKSMLDDVIKNCNRAPNWQNDDGSKKLLGGDYMLPHEVGLLISCSNLPQGSSHLKWLERDIRFNAKWTPMREPNQLIAKCIEAGPEYVEFYKEKTPNWKQAIENYWYKNDGFWRKEPEVAEAMIRKVHG